MVTKEASDAGSSNVAVLFDFDGTVGDTETPAMKIAYWEICPYLMDVNPANAADSVAEYVRNNAGKAFEFMVDDADKARKAAGLKESCMECWKSRSEDEAIVTVVDEHRAKFGLPGLRNAATNYKTFLQQQKIETVEALSKVSLSMSLFTSFSFTHIFPFTESGASLS
eukprot:71435_1